MRRSSLDQLTMAAFLSYVRSLPSDPPRRYHVRQAVDHPEAIDVGRRCYGWGFR